VRQQCILAGRLDVKSLFGQLWLWLVLGLLAGAAVLWFVVVRPGRNRADAAGRVTFVAPLDRDDASLDRDDAPLDRDDALHGRDGALHGRDGARHDRDGQHDQRDLDTPAMGFRKPLDGAWQVPAEEAPTNGADSQAQDVEDGPYPGSAVPVQGGAAPSAEFVVKGNEDSMLYHTPESPYFGMTRAEVWFRSEVDAQRAGFAAWR
jgi:hypothetical protein